jgi:archaellum component FlaF (FlaF/FlaG flagellin family)
MDPRGFSAVVGTVFMVLVVMLMSTGVFLWTLAQNTEYNQAVKQSNQLDIERLNEKVTASNVNYTVSSGKVYVSVIISNEGSLSAKIVTLWVVDTNAQTYGFNTTLDIDLNPGETIDFREDTAIVVTVPGSSPAHTFSSWFVTARGNTIPLEGEQGITVANLAQGIGSITMDFDFRYYEVPNSNPGTDLGSPIYSFTVDGGKLTVFCVTLTNLDPSRQTINLSSNSYIWAVTPYASTVKGDSWPIIKVENNKLAVFDYQLLPYNVPTEVYFGPHRPQFVSGTVPVFILLFGKIGNDDYGQNIPFIALLIE